jgi:hypothetical protein
MKPLRLLALSIAATAWCATAAFACDGTKASAANTASCCAKSAGTKSASAASCGTKSSSTTAVAAASKTAAGPACPATGACPMTSEQCKAAMASGACTAEMQAACAAKGTKTASAGKCNMHATAAHTDCVVCSDEMACDDDIRATGARAQVVALRNGTMIVYMLDGTGNVRALQSAVARHNAQVVAALQGDSNLCSACKKLRGALASGKLVREVVNVERGCQLLITSSDRSIVQQVQACSNAQVAARTKS